jgi:hypothetical protein
MWDKGDNTANVTASTQIPSGKYQNVSRDDSATCPSSTVADYRDYSAAAFTAVANSRYLS